jgi:catechol 2,3-dioxygenase-like lactoylglutathione lyase family enzyme
MPNFIRRIVTKEEAIPILRVSKASDAVNWYARLGFRQEWEHRFEPGLPTFVSIVRQGVRLFLSEHAGDARPDTLVYIRVKQIASIAKEFGVPVTEQPWAHEIHLQDPDGNRLRIGTPK